MANRTKPSLSVEVLKSKCLVGDCWLWQSTRTPAGYGLAWCPDLKKYVSSHRRMAELALGKTLATTDVVMHACDTPSCCNPAHLSVGTQTDNQQDCLHKGRRFVALSERDSTFAREWGAAGWPKPALAQALGVSLSTVYKAVRFAP